MGRKQTLSARCPSLLKLCPALPKNTPYPLSQAELQKFRANLLLSKTKKGQNTGLPCIWVKEVISCYVCFAAFQSLKLVLNQRLKKNKQLISVRGQKQKQ